MTSVSIHVQIATSLSIQIPLSLSWVIMCTVLLVWFCQFVLVGPLIWFPYLHELFLVILVPAQTSVHCLILPLYYIISMSLILYCSAVLCHLIV